MQRREFLAALAAAFPTLAQNKRLRVACDTGSWTIEVPEFQNLLRVLGEAKELGYEGFETAYRNVQGQFENFKEARTKLDATGMAFYGVHIFQHDYDPKSNIPPHLLMQRIAEGVKKLGCQRLIVSGSPTGGDPERLRWKYFALARGGRMCRDLNLERLCYQGPVDAELGTLIKESDPDTVRFILENPPAEFFSKFHKRIDGLHLASLPADNDALAAAVKKTGWQGWIVAAALPGGEENGPGRSAMEPVRAEIRKRFNA
ncbi:hypothetical protein F183_A47140 [Bryobacterales bacterium F-183]|nr:hypothetical protein F183_A47140 [Bryobacterales bacterium F-183]